MSDVSPIIDDIKVFFANKKRKNIFILCVLLLILGIVFAKNTYQKMSKPEPTVKRVLICPRCDFKKIEELNTIDGKKCQKCNASMGYGWKCNKCSYEYSVKKMLVTGKLNKELIALRRAETKCPNCDSEDTNPLSTKK